MTTFLPVAGSNTNGVFDFIVYHPYPNDPTPDWTDNSISGLVADLEGIWDWQDVCRNGMYSALSVNQRPFNVPLLATEWNGDFSTGNGGLAASMWTMLADTETVLSMARGQQTLDANYYPDTGPLNGSCWPLLFTRFQSNLGNYYVSSSYGNNVPAEYLPPGSTIRLVGSDGSPFRVYSTLNSNSSGVVTESVWMLSFTNSGNQTVNLHFPAAISNGTIYTLGNSNTSIAPNLINQSTYSESNFMWFSNSISPTNGASMVVTIPQATLMVAQVAFSNAPTLPAAPAITNMPAQGQPGQVITIGGKNFSPNLLQNVVYFGPVRGTVLSASVNGLTVQVPYGAGYGPVTVTVSNLTCYSSNFFNPAYFGASVTNPIVMSAVATNALSNLAGGGNLELADLGLMDINGDGKPDLMYLGSGFANNVITNLGEMALYLNGSSGPGNFTLATNSPFMQPANYYPTAMAFGDFDGDGLPDWVWIDLNDIIVCGNTSTPQSRGASSRYNQYYTGRGPFAIKVADIDGDGKPDILVANQTDGTVSVFRNLSSGTGNIIFAQKVDFPACTNVQRFVVADFNGDGKPDIAVVSWTNSGSSFFILTNKSTPGTISFSSPIAIDSIDEPDGIAVGDFNMDGKMDIAVGSYGDSRVYVYINNGTGGSTSFATKVIAAGYSGVSDPREIAVADFNGDGLPDIAVVNGVSTMYTFQNAWTGGTFTIDSFNSPSGYSTGSSAATSVCCVSADMDGDGRPDVVVGNFGLTNVVIFQNASQY
jgi:hypothetical protein